MASTHLTSLVLYGQRRFCPFLSQYPGLLLGGSVILPFPPGSVFLSSFWIMAVIACLPILVLQDTALVGTAGGRGKAGHAVYKSSLGVSCELIHVKMN